MGFNRYKKRYSKFNNLVKELFFGKGIKKRRLIFGKAKGITVLIDPATRFQLLMGIYEYEIQNLFTVWAKQCNYFFDAGAGDGYYSLFYKKYAPGGVAYLFDNDASMTKIEQEHFACNGISKGYEINTKKVSVADNDNEVTLNSYSLQEQNILVKIDVEGAEMEVLHGANRLLKNNNCFLLIETHALRLEQEAIAFLQNLGYHTQIIRNAWWRFFIAERRPLAHNRWLAAWKAKDV